MGLAQPHKFEFSLGGYALPLSCIIYDLDGTLIDSAPDIAIAVNRVRRHYYLDELTEMDVRDFIGDGARRLIERAVFGLVDDPSQRPEKRLPKSAADIDQVTSLFRDIYSEDPVIETTMAKGVERTLKHWQDLGVAQVCLTNKPHQLSLSVLEGMGLLGYFDLVVGAGAKDDDGETLPRKPDTAVLDFVVDQTGAPREETVLVGDGLPDFEIARKGGIPCIALLCGYTPSQVVIDQADDLDMVAASFLEARDILLRLNESI